MEIQIPHEIHETHSFFSPKKKLLPLFSSSSLFPWHPLSLLPFHSLSQDSLNKFLCLDTSFSLHTLFLGIRRLLSNFVSTEVKKVVEWNTFSSLLCFQVSCYCVSHEGQIFLYYQVSFFVTVFSPLFVKFVNNPLIFSSWSTYSKSRKGLLLVWILAMVLAVPTLFTKVSRNMFSHHVCRSLLLFAKYILPEFTHYFSLNFKLSLVIQFILMKDTLTESLLKFISKGNEWSISSSSSH